MHASGNQFNIMSGYAGALLPKNLQAATNPTSAIQMDSG
jgi:hypothetical protein